MYFVFFFWIQIETRKTTQTKPKPNQNQTKPNQTKPNQTKPNQTKPNQYGFLSKTTIQTKGSVEEYVWEDEACFVVLCCVMLCYLAFCCVLLCFVVFAFVLCFVVLCFVVLCFCKFVCTVYCGLANQPKFNSCSSPTKSAVRSSVNKHEALRLLERPLVQTKDLVETKKKS